MKGERGRGVFDAPDWAGAETTLAVLRRAALLLTRALSLVGGGGGEGGDWRFDLKGDGGLGMLVGAFRDGGLELELGVGRLSKLGLTVTCEGGGVDGEDGWDAGDQPFSSTCPLDG